MWLRMMSERWWPFGVSAGARRGVSLCQRRHTGWDSFTRLWVAMPTGHNRSEVASLALVLCLLFRQGSRHKNIFGKPSNISGNTVSVTASHSQLTVFYVTHTELEWAEKSTNEHYC